MADIPLDGMIDKVMVDDVLQRLKPGDRLIINSRGGNLREADRLAKFVQENGIDTHAAATAWLQSSAVLVFAAGKNRTAGKNLNFTLHPVLDADTGKPDPQSTAWFRDRLIGLGISNQVGAVLGRHEGMTFGYDAAKSIGLVNADRSRAASAIFGPLE